MQQDLDSNILENWFGTSTAGDQKTFWGQIVDAGGQIVGSIPAYVDGYVGQEFIKNTTQENENITSKQPAVSAEANKATAQQNAKAQTDKTLQYILIGGGILVGAIVIAKAL